ncbi:MAG TPA: class I SAM-dependent methyltransferase [Terriglobia bacterium]|nr:class I SAM-dependent methyltransferase [Terriglobia bacterium]
MSLLDRYLTVGLRSVEGWLADYSAHFIAALSEVQHHAGYTGAVGEIGVYRGKLFILLLLAALQSEKAFALDVFEDQTLNTDGSGSGASRDLFLANVRRWAASDANVLVIARPSFDVRADDILAVCGKVRLLSVDGGHTEECAMNDLHLAEEALLDQGVAIIDDYFNPHWPGVSTGVGKYLMNPDSKLRPFAISPNKLYLTRPQNCEFYRFEMNQRFRPQKESRMFGSAVDIYGINPEGVLLSRPLTLASLAKMRLKQSALGPQLLAAKAFLERR